MPFAGGRGNLVSAIERFHERDLAKPVPSDPFRPASRWQESLRDETETEFHMPAPQLSPRGRPKPLSRREQMVLSLIAEGMTNTEIAASLHLARSTVKRYVASIMWKLEVHTRDEAVRKDHETCCARVERAAIRSGSMNDVNAKIS